MRRSAERRGGGAGVVVVVVVGGGEEEGTVMRSGMSGADWRVFIVWLSFVLLLLPFGPWGRIVVLTMKQVGFTCFFYACSSSSFS